MPDDIMSPADLTERTRRAVAAAVAGARRGGLRASAASVLYDAFSVIVHLSPAPVVVRVPKIGRAHV